MDATVKHNNSSETAIETLDVEDEQKEEDDGRPCLSWYNCSDKEFVSSFTTTSTTPTMGVFMWKQKQKKKGVYVLLCQCPVSPPTNSLDRMMVWDATTVQYRKLVTLSRYQKQVNSK